MEQNYDNIPIFKHISEVTEDTKEYIRKRQTREIEPLKTRWNKFNDMCSIEPGNVYTIAGISGTGKSSFINTLQLDLIELNPNQDIVVLSFSFEMLSRAQVGRTLSNKLHQTTKAVYTLDSISMNEINNTLNEIKDYPIYFIDEYLTVQQIDKTISFFQNTIAKDKWLVVVLDHTLLVSSENYKDERMIVTELEKVFIKAKKIGKTTIFQLSQMNRNIENIDRINNPSAHYPMRSDLSSSDSVFQGSDVIAVLHRPEILGLMAYGVQRLPVQNRIYLHFLKVREGELAILEFENDLKYNNLIEL